MSEILKLTQKDFRNYKLDTPFITVKKVKEPDFVKLYCDELNARGYGRRLKDAIEDLEKDMVIISEIREMLKEDKARSK